MSVNPQENQQSEAQKPSDKELNFRKQEEMFNRKLEQERLARQQTEEKLAQLEKVFQERTKSAQNDEDDDDDEPYVDKKRLRKELGKVVQQTVNETDSRIHNAVQQALASERQTQWMKNNPDFYDVMNHAQDFADRDPELAETILAMPEGFERQKLVYKNIKALGLHKKQDSRESIQEKVDQNRRSPYYQPSGVASAPYGVVSSGRDWSPTEGQNAYKKMMELKSRLRI
jgi:hypothetical protein